MLDKLIVWSIAVIINGSALYFCYKIGKVMGWQKLWLVFMIMPIVAMIFRISAIINLYAPNDLLTFIMNYVSTVVFSIAVLVYSWYSYKIFKFHFGHK